jgi:DNA-binding transcriptional LysR family regulator
LGQRARRTKRRRLIVGFVASTIYGRLPPVIREFRRSAPHVELTLVEMSTLEQIRALKDGRIDVGFGRIRFEDESVQRIVLRDEKLVAALPAAHPLSRLRHPISLASLADSPLIVYPREPRPSYADQVLALFRDHGVRPRIAHEARELQIAIGLVAAEEGVCVVPDAIRKLRVDDVRYVEILEHATSPIIMSCRSNEISPELRTIASVIARMYRSWGYSVPDGLSRLVAESA